MILREANVTKAQIYIYLDDPAFDPVFDGKNNQVREALEGVCMNFKGNKRVNNYPQLMTVLR